LVRFDGAKEALMQVSIASRLSYRELDGTVREQALVAAIDPPALGESGEYYQQRGVHQTVALAVLTQSMQDAARRYATEPAVASAILERAVVRFEADTVNLGDPSFQRELELVKKLRDLVATGAPQGSMYPGN
jgi:hypothetical protein